jgi:hypothetical protein
MPDQRRSTRRDSLPLNQQLRALTRVFGTHRDTPGNPDKINIRTADVRAEQHGRSSRQAQLQQAPRLRREHLSDHAPGRAPRLDLRRPARPPARPDLRPTPRHQRRLHWAASQLDLPTLADSGYEATGAGIHTPVKQPADRALLAPNNRAHHILLRSLRGQGERGFALRTGRWRGQRHTTASPNTVGDIVRAGLVLTQFEYRYQPNPC